MFLRQEEKLGKLEMRVCRPDKKGGTNQKKRDKKRDCSRHETSLLSTYQPPLRPAIESHHSVCCSVVEKAKLAMSREPEFKDCELW